jgi:hypothetical protein
MASDAAHSREAEALPTGRLIRLKSPQAPRVRDGTGSGTQAQKSHGEQLQHQAPIAPYVTSDAKETLVTNYNNVIAIGVIKQ